MSSHGLPHVDRQKMVRQLLNEMEANGGLSLLTLGAGPLATAAISVKQGGLGFSLTDCAVLQRELATRSPSLAIAFNMHTLTVGLMADHWRRHRDASWMMLEGLAAAPALIASAFAEPGGRSNLMAPSAVARAVDGGYRVTGTKYPCSLISSAELFCLSARCGDEAIVCVVPRGLDGLVTNPRWLALGMADSDTGELHLDEVFVDRRLVFHRGPLGTADDVVVSGVLWFVVLAAATYEGVLATLIAGLPRHRPSDDQDVGLAMSLVLALRGHYRSLSIESTQDTLKGQAALAAAMALRLHMSQVRDQVVALITPVYGSSIFSAESEAARLALDSLAVHHHPPSVRASQIGLADYQQNGTIRLDVAEGAKSESSAVDWEGSR